MRMTLALRTARRWLGWIHYTDRVRYLRRQAHQAADVEQTMRTLRDIAEADQQQAVTELTAAVAAAVQTGTALEATRQQLVEIARHNRMLMSQLDDANELITGQRQLIERLGNQLAASARLADMTPARRAAAMAAVDPTSEFGWRE